MDFKLSRGHVTQIDEDDLPLVLGYTWRRFEVRHIPGLFYAVTTLPRQLEGPRRVLRMHRVIMGLGPGDPFVDHRDHDGLNNQRSNLRLATPSENGGNRRPDQRVRYRGVSWNKRDRKWQVHISVRGHTRSLGYFDDPVEAAHAYDAAAREGWGEFAATNF